MTEDSWNSGILSALESLSSTLPSGDKSPSQQQVESNTSVQSSDDTSYISWLRSAKGQLDELSLKVQSANWGPLSSTPTTPEAVGSSADDSQSSYVDSLKLPILAQIESLQLLINSHIDGARVACNDALQGMLPEQIQIPWITESARICIDPELHPEMLQSATVRMGHGICGQEADFQQKRARHMRNDFAGFIGVSAASVDERDIPIIGVAGSGGGFRAMVSTIGYYRAMHISGFARCITYDAAVSGSSWAVAALHTYANGSPFRVLDNVREAMRQSMFSTTNLMNFVKSNDAIAKRVFVDMAAKYLLLISGKLVQRAAPPDSNDQHMISSADDSGTARRWSVVVYETVFKLLQQGHGLAENWFLDYYRRQGTISDDTPTPSTVSELADVTKGAIDTIPMPQLSIVDLYGALLFKHLIVQHNPALDDSGAAELSLDPKWTKLSAQRDAIDQGRLPMPIYTAVRHFIGSTDNDTLSTGRHGYQWFEFSPFEFGSIDHGAWIPAWAFGRPMIDGKGNTRVGEAHFGSIMGTVASAFCASVKAMIIEVYINIPTVLRFVVDPLLDWVEHDTEIAHIVPPYTLHNPFFRTQEKRSIENALQSELESEQLLSLMDAGLENNLPFTPLLRKDRSVDMIVCLDSSANIDIMPWFARAEAWAARHQVGRWPWGARPWASDPLRPSTAEVEMHRSMLSSTKQASKNAEGQLKDGNVRCVVFDRPLAPSPLRDNSPQTLSSVLQPPISVLYLPLLRNKGFRDPAFDPGTADFCDTFNDKWKPEQVDLLADLASFNFMQETERIRSAVRQAYERKRAYRLYVEDLEKQGKPVAQ